MTKQEAKRWGSLCTGRYRRGPKVGKLCMKVGKFFVQGEGRCAVHTPPKLRTTERAI